MVVGSYLATVLLRWPEEESANHGRSRCDRCKRQLLWHELAPLASYVVTKGRCRTCSGTISPLNPLMEASCGFAGAVLFGLGAPGMAPMVWLLVCLALFDILFLWLPNRLVLLLALVCFLIPLPDATDFEMRLAGGLIGFGALWLVGEGFRLATGKVGLGGGDPKLFGAIGLWCGALNLPVVLLIACGIGFADAGVRLLRGQTIRGLRMPLGAYLCMSSMMAVLFQAMEPGVRPSLY